MKIFIRLLVLQTFKTVNFFQERCQRSTGAGDYDERKLGYGTNRVGIFAAVFLLATGFVVSQEAPTIEPLRNLDHQRHRFKHGDRFKTEPATASRFTTSRTSNVAFSLPVRDDSFTFVVLGDRTSGQDKHVSVLADAVHDVNLLEPDLVMNIGDMVQGYNATELWTRQMLEYKEIMNELKCPWFPTAGNHDVCWGGPDRPKYQHEENFEMHFGPLWYAFEHRNCWFVVLFTDEGDRATGAKSFSNPDHQKMTEEQFQWLRATLQKAKGADHVFLFQHHPRWQNRNDYGDDWDRVHRLLVEAGNVAAVFAGHTHRMRYEKRDGIEYVTLSTTGGNFQADQVLRLGFQDNFLVMTVRKSRVSMAAIPVASMIDPRELTTEATKGTREIDKLKNAKTDPVVPVDPDGAVDAETTLSLTNPSAFPIDVVAELDSKDSRWERSAYPLKITLRPGEQRDIPFRLKRPDHSFDKAFREPFVKLAVVVHAEGMKIPFPEIRAAIPLDLKSALEKRRLVEQAVLKFGAAEDRLSLPHFGVKKGAPFTLETWFRAETLDGRISLFSKGRSHGELAFYLEDGKPRFQVPLASQKRVVVRAPDSVVAQPKRWHHLAGVYDGKEVRLYLDGKSVATAKATEPFQGNASPVSLGAYLDPHAGARFGLVGAMDSVRFSKSARYQGDRFEPSRDFEPDPDTLLLLDMQQSAGKWVPAHGENRIFGVIEGDADILPEASLN